MSEPIITVETITPDIAEDWLTANTHNRPILESKVTQYTNDIKEGRWKFNGDSIKFDYNNVLLDGQHRLYAIFKSGISVKCVVIRGLAPEAQNTMDLGASRTAGQMGVINKIANANVVAAIARLIIIYEKYDKTFSTAQGPSVPQVHEYVVANNDMLQHIAKATNPPSLRNLATQSVLGVYYYLFSKQNQEKCDTFFKDLQMGGLPNTHPIYHLRERLLIDRSGAKGRGVSIQREVTLALFFKAWNYYKADKKMIALRFRNDEGFPAI